MALFFYFIPEEHREKADNHIIDVSWNPYDPKASTIRFFLDKFATFKGVPADRLKMALLGFKTHGMALDDDSTLDELMECMNDKSHNLKVFVLQLSEVEAKIAQHPDSIVFIAKTIYKDKALTFSKVVFMLPDDNSTILYERVFKKFAHFYKSQFEYPSQDYPALAVDYSHLFCHRFRGNASQWDFKLLVDTDMVDIMQARVPAKDIYDFYTERLKESNLSEKSSRSAFKKPSLIQISCIYSREGHIRFWLISDSQIEFFQISISA